MCIHTRLERKRNEVIIEKVGMAPIEDKIRDSRLKWCGCIKRKGLDARSGRFEMLGVSKYKRCKGRLKKSWSEVKKMEMALLQLL